MGEADSGEEMGSGLVDPAKSGVVLYRSYDSNDEGVVFTASELRLRVPHSLLERLGNGEPVNAIVLDRNPE